MGFIPSRNTLGSAWHVNVTVQKQILDSCTDDCRNCAISLYFQNCYCVGFFLFISAFDQSDLLSVTRFFMNAKTAIRILFDEYQYAKSNVIFVLSIKLVTCMSDPWTYEREGGTGAFFIKAQQNLGDAPCSQLHILKIVSVVIKLNVMFQVAKDIEILEVHQRCIYSSIHHN